MQNLQVQYSVSSFVIHSFELLIHFPGMFWPTEKISCITNLEKKLTGKIFLGFSLLFRITPEQNRVVKPFLSYHQLGSMQSMRHKGSSTVRNVGANSGHSAGTKVSNVLAPLHSNPLSISHRQESISSSTSELQ